MSVAKKKTKSAKSQPTKVKKESKESMLSKIEVKEPKDPEGLSRVVGGIFILLGIFLISYGIYSLIKFNKIPELDEDLTPPSLSGTVTLTNAEEIEIVGTAEDFDQVFVYADNDEVGKAKVAEDSTFKFLHPVESEGIYAISVAGVRGFPKRYISSQSDMKLVEVDRTDPELVSIKYPTEVGTDTFSVIGEVEPACTVVLKRGSDSYEGACDDEGIFKVEKISLEEGANVFTGHISDAAGNTVEIGEKIKVIYSQDSDINGNAVLDELPVASGELESAMRFLKQNSLMMIMGVMALLALLGSSAYVITQKRHI